VVGFLSGRIRAHAPHFGGRSVGYLSELFVIESCRRRGIADELLSAGIAWFRERNINRFELPVVINNSQARNFYLRRGWVEEFTQLVLQDRPVYLSKDQ
jgi:GNAT superfamily N-acetyltransferase